MDNIRSLGKMVFGRPKQATADTEQGVPSQVPHAHSQPSLIQHEHADHDGRPQIAADDQLNLFRHLTGITSHTSMAHVHAGDGGRHAPNLGIYTRVVQSEETAKIGYKYFSWLINGCLGLQIIVAASLTAMGAAGAGRAVVTVFGAINTVIAGVLTFLKGSGLPNRFKYYETQWKRVREFIEQRERDFGRPNCDLDIYHVVEMVESLYEEVKLEVEASSPDRFAGASSSRQAIQQNPPAIGVMLPRATTEHLTEKIEEIKSVADNKATELESGLGGMVKDLASEIGRMTHLAQKAAHDLRAHTQKDIEETVGEVKSFEEQIQAGGASKHAAQ